MEAAQSDPEKSVSERGSDADRHNRDFAFQLGSACGHDVDVAEPSTIYPLPDTEGNAGMVPLQDIEGNAGDDDCAGDDENPNWTNN